MPFLPGTLMLRLRTRWAGRETHPPSKARPWPASARHSRRKTRPAHRELLPTTALRSAAPSPVHPSTNVSRFREASDNLPRVEGTQAATLLVLVTPPSLDSPSQAGSR